MTRSALQTIETRPRREETTAAPVVTESTTAEITEFAKGVLAGSIASSDSRRPDTLLVTANGRTIGEAKVSWDAAPQTPSQTPSHRTRSIGTWSFDALDLPPNLLLEDRTGFSVGLSAQPMVPLDTIEIARSQFPRARSYPPRQSTLKGFLDGTENGVVRGWVWEPTNVELRIKVLLFVDDLFCGTQIADLWRPDLEATGRGDGRYGFSISAQNFFEQAGRPRPEVRVVAGAPHHWVIPPAPHMRSSRSRAGASLLQLLRRREMPRTPRELTTILSSDEPFPKKIYVIDRLKRKMPDGFSADYALLALEFLRIEMLELEGRAPATWLDRVALWWRQRAIRRQVRRLSTLAKAVAASQGLIAATARRPTASAGRTPR